jgi:hypothetical protein
MKMPVYATVFSTNTWVYFYNSKFNFEKSKIQSLHFSTGNSEEVKFAGITYISDYNIYILNRSYY